jgi:hypothetical protein
MPKFEAAVLKAVDAARSLGVRSGDTHKHTNVWVVVISGRILVRSWNDKPTGWFRAFLRKPEGIIRVGKKEVPARGKRVRNAKILNAMSAALAEKYPHKGSQHYIDGFRTAKRKATTLEFVPR